MQREKQQCDVYMNESQGSIQGSELGDNKIHRTIIYKEDWVRA